MRSIRPSFTRHLLWVVLWLLAAAAASAQLPPNAVKTRFEPNGDFLLELNGEELPGARFYFSQQAAAYLITTPEIQAPLLLSQRTGGVHEVDQILTLPRPDGAFDVLTGAVLAQVASFEALGQVVFWSIRPHGEPQKDVKMRPRPWLLGSHPPEKLFENPSYAYKAKGYSPDEEALAALKAIEDDVRVVVYFGSWCPHCKQIVPLALRVAQELAGSPVRFEWYGLPQPMTGDPEAARAGINSVPTAVVFVGGEEKGRLDGYVLKEPEAALKRLLDGS